MSDSNKSKRSAYVVHLTRAALIAAIIFVMTSFLKLPTATGYVHLGTSIIYGDFAVSLPEIPTNLLQGAVGAVIFSVMGAFLDANPRMRKIIRGR